MENHQINFADREDPLLTSNAEVDHLIVGASDDMGDLDSHEE